MITSTHVFARLGALGIVVSVVYIAPLVFAAQLSPVGVQELNNKNMEELTTRKLNAVTKEFLTAIDEAETLYESKNFSTGDEVVVCTRLRDAFDIYFATLIPFETQQGQELTERSREVIQEAIAEFMEFDSNLDHSTEVALDLDAYSKVMTEALIHTAVAV